MLKIEYIISTELLSSITGKVKIDLRAFRNF